MTLGNRIQQARKRLPKMTQEKLGAEFGISDKAVSSWERDDTVPDVAKMAGLRRVLRVTYAWLLEGDGPPPDPNDPRVLWDDQAPAQWAAPPAQKEPPRKVGTRSR